MAGLTAHGGSSQADGRSARAPVQMCQWDYLLQEMAWMANDFMQVGALALAWLPPRLHGSVGGRPVMLPVDRF